MLMPNKRDRNRRRFLIELGSGAVVMVSFSTSFLKSALSDLLPEKGDYQFFTQDEAQKLIVAVDTLIPRDDLSPSASELGVPIFIDRQLAGAFGAGSRLYKDGPVKKGTATQGRQNPMIPALIYRRCLAELDTVSLKDSNTKFIELTEDGRRKLFIKLETDNNIMLGEIPGKLFFEILYQNAMEGFFSDPVYGGNKDMASWKMIGFPGIVANYSRDIEMYRNKAYDALPKGIGDVQS